MSTHTAIPKSQDTEVRITRSTFKGKERIDVREYWRPDDAPDHRPTKKGINLPLEHLPRLLHALHEIEAEAIRDGDLLIEDFENAGIEPPAELKVNT